MKKFLRNSALFSVLVLISILAIFYQADGYSDPFYVRFTSPKQNSLILGTSKAAHALQPTELKKDLPNHSILNYAFTVAHSPYGPGYYKSIQRKVKDDAQNGIFIITVDAWSIASDGKDPDDEVLFSENKSFLNNLETVSAKPNIPYLWTWYRKNYLKIFERDPVMFLHDDGWLEIDVPVDEETVAKRIKNKSEELREKRELFQFSETRLNYLYKTIQFLQQKGEVYLVKLPVHPDLTELDDAVIPDFKEIMNDLTSETNIPYLDLTAENTHLKYVDGIHIHKDSGKLLSRKVAQWIKARSKEYP